jgi:hypothetical protein
MRTTLRSVATLLRLDSAAARPHPVWLGPTRNHQLAVYNSRLLCRKWKPRLLRTLPM